MLNALSSYLQNQQSVRTSSSSTTAVQGSRGADESNDSLDGYAPSKRMILVSAVATDFDVRALKRQDVGNLQQTLMQYGLVGGRDLDAFAFINTQFPAEGEATEAIDALGLLDKVTEEFTVRNLPYSGRQQVSNLHRLLHNLDSARQTLL